jgi:hypothetical protein
MVESRETDREQVGNVAPPLRPRLPAFGFLENIFTSVGPWGLFHVDLAIHGIIHPNLHVKRSIKRPPKSL